MNLLYIIIFRYAIVFTYFVIIYFVYFISSYIYNIKKHKYSYFWNSRVVRATAFRLTSDNKAWENNYIYVINIFTLNTIFSYSFDCIFDDIMFTINPKINSKIPITKK